MTMVYLFGTRCCGAPIEYHINQLHYFHLFLLEYIIQHVGHNMKHLHGGKEVETYMECHTFASNFFGQIANHFYNLLG